MHECTYATLYDEIVALLREKGELATNESVKDAVARLCVQVNFRKERDFDEYSRAVDEYSRALDEYSRTVVDYVTHAPKGADEQMQIAKENLGSLLQPSKPVSKQEQHYLNFTPSPGYFEKYRDAWTHVTRERIPPEPAQEKYACDCGATKAKTSHSDWCSASAK